MHRNARDGLAIVLRTVDYGETDRIVHLFTRDAGRVASMAKGARRSKKRFAGALQTGQLVRARWVEGRSALGRLESAETVQTFDGLLGLERGLRAGEALALLRGVLEPEQPEPELFDALLVYLGAEAISSSPGPLIAFLFTALRLLGVEPNLASCGGCGKHAPRDRPAYFDPARGALVCRACGGHGHVLTPQLRDRASLVLQNGDIPVGENLSELLALARALTRIHVGGAQN